MAAFYLDNLGRNVVRLAGAGRLTVTNTSEHPAQVFVDVKEGGAWRMFHAPVTLERGARWSVSHDELGADQVRVTARGSSDGRHIVRVEH